MPLSVTHGLWRVITKVCSAKRKSAPPASVDLSLGEPARWRLVADSKSAGHIDCKGRAELILSDDREAVAASRVMPEIFAEECWSTSHERR